MPMCLRLETLTANPTMTAMNASRKGATTTVPPVTPETDGAWAVGGPILGRRAGRNDGGRLAGAGDQAPRKEAVAPRTPDATRPRRASVMTVTSSCPAFG